MDFAPGAFRGRTAFVTGGGTGLGLAVARRLGRLGAHVVVASRDVAHHAALGRGVRRRRARGDDALPVDTDAT
ncbi:MAG: SDR family NAD(P)-dependent oxidoreductase [Planctomycetia bacterium]|nr:SDR family NAD(P)-dependent oxidoreductase [Planctomycetia bacterium]